MQMIIENSLNVKILSTYGSPNIKFDDEKLEKEYFNSNEPQNIKNSKIIYFCFFFYIFNFCNIMFNKCK